MATITPQDLPGLFTYLGAETLTVEQLQQEALHLEVYATSMRQAVIDGIAQGVIEWATGNTLRVCK